MRYNFGFQDARENPMSSKRDSSDTALRARLSPEQYHITQEQGTEAPFSGQYCAHKADGTYVCVCCGNELFRSAEKYDSGSGWPSFWVPLAGDRVTTRRDTSHGMIRDEVVCSACEAHLGHVFPDGPQPSGLRYCINSGALDFDPSDDGADGS